MGRTSVTVSTGPMMSGIIEPRILYVARRKRSGRWARARVQVYSPARKLWMRQLGQQPAERQRGRSSPLSLDSTRESK